MAAFEKYAMGERAAPVRKMQYIYNSDFRPKIEGF
jgi:hypothetical protein